MSRPLEDNLDFNLNQAKNMIMEELDSDPTTLTEARLWYNTTEKVAKYWNGTILIILDNVVTNLDGGGPNSVYGGLETIDAGGIV